ncbi:MAG: tRNA (adenosine(37)-N6)-threonylcarbamoyltransferase complex dimerization subunit type 1 TsaB [Steroidobacterales bacterium]
MRILAIDTTTEACSAALLVGDAVFARSEEPGRGHSNRILGMVDEILAEAGIALGRLDGIAAGIGPGAFTGVRICVAVAQGLAFGAALPVVPISGLEALAFERMQRGAERVLACLDARMAEVYWACYRADLQRGLVVSSAAAVGAPASVQLPADALVPGAGYYGIGRGLAAHPQLLDLPGLRCDAADRRALPDARAMVHLGAVRFRGGEGIDPGALAPLYLRDNVALTEAQRGST